MSTPKDSCVEPARGPILESDAATAEASPEPRTGGGVMRARVGSPAPDFEAAAYIDGGFRNVKLSDFRGKWVVLCFYPGDFTFV